MDCDLLPTGSMLSNATFSHSRNRGKRVQRRGSHHRWLVDGETARMGEYCSVGNRAEARDLVVELLRGSIGVHADRHAWAASKEPVTPVLSSGQE